MRKPGRDAELDGGLGYEIGADGSLFAREIDTNQGKTCVLTNAADSDPSAHCVAELVKTRCGTFS